MNAATQHNESVFRSKVVCYTLALLAMATTIWYIVNGIQATEPDSPARYAKIVSGALMVVIEAVVFSQAGKWLQFSFVQLCCETDRRPLHAGADRATGGPGQAWPGPPAKA